MGKWLSKDPDAYLPDRPPLSEPSIERAREHLLRRDGPPAARDWRRISPPWRATALLLVGWAAVAYAATVLSGATASLDTVVLALPIVALTRSDALHVGGAALLERRDHPTAKGHPLGGAPWLVILAVHLAGVFAVVGLAGALSADEAIQRLAVLASGFVAGLAGLLVDLAWGRRERAVADLPPTLQ